MFTMDMPAVPPQEAPVMIAQSTPGQLGHLKAPRTLGVCHPVPNEYYSGENGVSPKTEAAFYLRAYDSRRVTNIDTGIITILQQPEHGRLRLMTEADRGTLFSSSSGPIDPADPGYAYLPEKGYVGKDKAVVLVEIAGVRVKVIYFFHAVNGVATDAVDSLCGKKGYWWKISATLDIDSNSKLTAFDNSRGRTRMALT